jgi:hypothetical protein
VAQLVAHLVWDQRVVSSSLATPTKEKALSAVRRTGLCFYIALNACIQKQKEKQSPQMSEANEGLFLLNTPNQDHEIILPFERSE